MKIKWLYLIFAVLITPLAALTQEAKKSVYPGDFMPPGILIQKPIAYFKINDNPEQPSYGYSYNPDFADSCGSMCFEPGTKIIFSGHKDIKMPDGRKLRSGLVESIVTPNGEKQNVASEKITVPVGVVTTSGIPFITRKQEFTPSLPAGSFYANADGDEVDWAIPIEDTEGTICVDCKDEVSDGPVSTLKKLMGDIVDRFTPEPAPVNVPASLNPPKKYDEFFAYQASLTSNPQQSLKNYNEYKKYIMAAAKAFNLPPDMMFCLKHRESREDRAGGKKAVVDWFPRAVSGTGAVGLGQLLPGTAFDLVTRIPDNHPRFKTSYQKYLNLVRKKHPAKYRIHSSSHYSKSQNPKSVYGRFAAQLRKKGRSSPVTFSGSNISDSNASQACDDRCDPAISIGLSAMYMRYILDNYGHKGANRNMSLDYKVFLTGAYNQGPGHVARIIKSGSGPSQWRASLVRRRGAEVRNHMKSTEDCMKIVAGQKPMPQRKSK